jgi:uncharacterized membrane protein YcaP (DUF421 family)
LLRIAGQQALAKMSGFDAVFTISLGSLIATVAVTKSLTISEALAAVVTFLILQEITRRLQSRFLLMHHAVRQAPQVLLWDGDLLEDRLREASISADEIRAAVRRAGHGSLAEVRVVVLENDGEWSVVPKSDGPSDESAFLGLPIPGRPRNSPKEHGATAQRAPVNRLP